MADRPRRPDDAGAAGRRRRRGAGRRPPDARPAGRSSPGTSTSAARDRPRGGRPGSAAGARDRRGPLARRRAFGLPGGDRRPPQARPAPRGGLRPPRARRRCPDGTPLPAPAAALRPRRRRARATGSGTIGTPCDRPVAASAAAERRPVLHSRPAADIRRRAPAAPAPAPRSSAGAHTRTVPTGTVPAAEPSRARRPVPGDEVRGGQEPTGGRAPCRPSRCGSCSRPESTSATRPAAGIPRCSPFIFAERNGIHIIDLAQTVQRLDVALEFVRETVARGDQVLFVGHQEAGPGAGRPGGDPRRPAVRQQALAGRHAHQLRRRSRSGSACSSSSRPASRTATSSG